MAMQTGSRDICREVGGVRDQACGLTPVVLPSEPTEGMVERDRDLQGSDLGQLALHCGNRTTSVRVLHLINGEHYSGAERVQDLLAANLPELGFQVHFACVKPGLFPSARKFHDAPLHNFPMRSRFSLGLIRKLVEYIRHEHIAIVHSHTPRTAMLGAVLASITRRPFVHHVHSPTHRDSTRRWQNWCNAFVERWSMRRAQGLIAVSHSLGNWLRTQQFPASKIYVVPNGVPQATRKRSDRRPVGDWTIGSIALYRPRKGIEILLEAMAMLRRDGHRVRLMAVGPFETDEYEQSIRRYVNKLGIEDIVHWTGFTQDVGEMLTRMDLHVLPSLFGEGLPMVVLEAMAAGVPTVATSVEGIPEAIRDGMDGLLVPPHDASALAAGIARFSTGQIDWQTVRDQALQRHATHFSDAIQAVRVADVYAQVLSARG